ncbi:MAG: methyltransferase domain-containing protein [Caldilineaceae bacterium]
MRPLRRRLTGRDFTAQHESVEPFWIADLGCGEGYYLAQFIQQCVAQDVGEVRCCGFDLSKDAVRMAAKLNSTGAFGVADIHRQIPLADQSMHVLLNIFAPRNAAEFARVLKPGGLLLVVIPTDEHLHEWRTALAQQGFNILGIESAKEQRLQEQFAAYFEPERMENVCYNIELAQNDLENLLRMTPNYWHVAEVELPQTPTCAPISTTVSVQILAWRR